MTVALREILMPEQANIITERAESPDGNKELYMSGIFIQGNTKNRNNRVYSVNEITNAVNSMREKIQGGQTILGEADHPDDLDINLDRVSHMIVDMSLNGTDGVGKLKLIATPMGNICKTLLESGVRLGVSSRGTGNVDANGQVSDFDIVTVDIVANPSAPNAYPNPIYEKLMNHKKSTSIWDTAVSVNHDNSAQKYLRNEITRFIEDLGR